VTKKKWQLTAIASAVCIVALGIGAFCYWQFRFKPWFIFEKTVYGNRRHLLGAISDFTMHKGRLPVDLREIVQEGYLPERSPVYQCPSLHNSLRDVPIPYTECEYDIQFEPNRVIVSLPRTVIDRYGLGKEQAHLIKSGVDDKGHVFDP